MHETKLRVVNSLCAGSHYALGPREHRHACVLLLPLQLCSAPAAAVLPLLTTQRLGHCKKVDCHCAQEFASRRTPHAAMDAPADELHAVLRACGSRDSEAARNALSRLETWSIEQIMPHFERAVLPTLASESRQVPQAGIRLCESMQKRAPDRFALHAQSFVRQLEQVGSWDAQSRGLCLGLLARLVAHQHLGPIGIPLPLSSTAQVHSFITMGQSTLYCIRTTWAIGYQLPEVHRRYSEFRSLHAQLGASPAPFRLPRSLKMPPRRLLVTNQVRHERVGLLDAWLRAVVAAAQRCAPPDVLCRFLGLSRPESLHELEQWLGDSPQCRFARSGRDSADSSSGLEAAGASDSTLPSAAGPVLCDAPALDGGIQGAAEQRIIIDEDGDEAHEFLTLE